MSTKDLSKFDKTNLPDIQNKTFGIVVAEWNNEITDAMYQGAINTLKNYGGKHTIKTIRVSGSFELSYGAQQLAQCEEVDAVIAIGCVIQGETKHNDYINHAVAQGLTQVSLKYNKPIIFGVLTPNNYQQALDRAGGQYGNKGDEAAITAIKLLGINV